MTPALRILIIEDDAETCSNLTDILSIEGHQVVTAHSFQGARDILTQQQFGVLISDRRLPDGLIEDELESIRTLSEDAEIIVVTGYGDMESTIAAFRQGVTDYVIKPIIPDALLSTLRRIAKNRQLQAELREEHAFANQVLDTAEAIVLILDLNGCVLRFNPYFQQLTGWTLDDLKGKDWFENCIPEEDHLRVKEVFIRTAHDIHTRGIVNAVVAKDGQSHQIRWSNTTLRNAHEETTAVLAVGVDVSDLAEAQTRALRAERLATIGQTMTALAHESRNALQRIQAASEVLSLEVEGNETALQDLRSIQRAGRDLQCLLEEVRSFAAPIQISPVSVPLSEVWNQSWKDLASDHKDRDAEIIGRISGSNQMAHVDVVRMEQVFRNLFQNSLAACEDPVRITIDCECTPSGFDVRVKDNGPGLSTEQRKRLFEPFYTTKSCGTGLGMPICQRIMDAHGGHITLDESAEGASFRLFLPTRVEEHIQTISSPLGSPARLG